jgi:hypothetical protein
MKFLGILKDAGHGLEIVAKDIETGIAVAQPIIQAIPGVNVEFGPILSVVEQSLLAITGAGVKLSSDQISKITQCIAIHTVTSQALPASLPVSGVYSLTPYPQPSNPKGQ